MGVVLLSSLRVDVRPCGHGSYGNRGIEYDVYYSQTALVGKTKVAAIGKLDALFILHIDLCFTCLMHQVFSGFIKYYGI